MPWGSSTRCGPKTALLETGCPGYWMGLTRGLVLCLRRKPGLTVNGFVWPEAGTTPEIKGLRRRLCQRSTSEHTCLALASRVICPSSSAHYLRAGTGEDSRFPAPAPVHSTCIPAQLSRSRRASFNPEFVWRPCATRILHTLGVSTNAQLLNLGNRRTRH